jgi:glycosyltransferase involved in cell wall biosynthesis
MINTQKLIVVMPAYNAGRTLKQTFSELPHDIVDEVILVDDHSSDNTVESAASLGIQTIISHNQNLGYGGNQKTCYTAALERGADIVVMIHPDYQYSPRLCGAMGYMIASGVYDVCLASRILGNETLRGGMPVWKYLANRALTVFENVMLGIKLSEYHTGYRAFSRKVLETLPLEANSNDFVFDNQMLAQCAYFGFRMGEISCPTVYAAESSSINFRRSVKYGFGVLGTSLSYRLNKWGIRADAFLARDGKNRLEVNVAKRGTVHRFPPPTRASQLH